MMLGSVVLPVRYGGEHMFVPSSENAKWRSADRPRLRHCVLRPAARGVMLTASLPGLEPDR
jgi:hypothetical protein